MPSYPRALKNQSASLDWEATKLARGMFPDLKAVLAFSLPPE